MRLHIEFSLDGTIDGAANQAAVEMGVEAAAQTFARDLKTLVLSESEDEDVTVRVNSRATARLYEDNEETGHATA